MSEYDIILIIFGVLVPIVSGFASWQIFKRKVKHLREFIDAVDDAIYDDKVSEDEFRFTWSKFLTLIQYQDKKTPGV